MKSRGVSITDVSADGTCVWFTNPVFELADIECVNCGGGAMIIGLNACELGRDAKSTRGDAFAESTPTGLPRSLFTLLLELRMIGFSFSEFFSELPALPDTASAGGACWDTWLLG
jgi:hypothetical protein